MSTVTYKGRLGNGKVDLPPLIDLPEGSEVYVVAQIGVEQHTAKKKANGWLVDHVGNMVMAGNGALIQSGDIWVWRFLAFLTSLTHEPYGPIGHVDIDANTGAVLSDQQTVQAMYERGQQYTPVS